MAWKKASPEMSDLLADALGPFPAEKRKMFGFPAYFANGNMFAGVFEDVIILRLADPTGTSCAPSTPKRGVQPRTAHARVPGAPGVPVRRP